MGKSRFRHGKSRSKNRTKDRTPPLITEETKALGWKIITKNAKNGRRRRRSRGERLLSEEEKQALREAIMEQNRQAQREQDAAKIEIEIRTKPPVREDLLSSGKLA